MVLGQTLDSYLKGTCLTAEKHEMSRFRVILAGIFDEENSTGLR